EPVQGLEEMRRRRGVSAPRLLCSGPARLTQAYGIGRPDNGMDLVGGRDLFVSAGTPVSDEQVGAGPRVGITAAIERAWRFFELGNPFVSRAGRVSAGPLRGGRRRRGR